MLALCAPAAAKDPGRWTLSGWSSVSNSYWQGVTSAGPTAPLYFSGPVEGLHRTNRWLSQTATISPAIPASVKAVEGYNHVGDISFDGRDGKRVLLPLECYSRVVRTGATPVEPARSVPRTRTRSPSATT